MNMKLLLESWKSHTQELLNEKKMEQVVPRFQSKDFLKAVKEFNEEEKESMTRFGMGVLSNPSPPQEIQERLTKQIPRDIKEKDKAEALDWMITSFIKTKDIDFYSKDIEYFYQIKQKGQDRLLAKNSIYTIKDSIELHEIIEAAKPGWDAYNAAQENKDTEKGMNKIYENDDWEVFIPENKPAACKLGVGSEWCTAAIGLEYYYHYHKPDDPLIIFISRKETFKKKVKEYNKKTKTWELVEKTFPVKYQFHYGSQQFMDKDDANISQTPVWYELNSIVANMDSPRLSDKIKEEAADYSEGFEKLPNGGYKVASEYTISYFDKDGKNHREDGPAFIELMDGRVFAEQWFVHGKKDRKDGPAQTKYYTNGKPYRQIWYNNGYPGRKDGGPAVVEYDESGKLFQEEWFDSYGNRDRKGAPAIVRADGIKIWYHQGDIHRFDGPAYEAPEGDKYYWRGGLVSKKQYKKHVDAYKHIPFEESLKRMIKEELVKVLKEERKLGKPSSETNLGDWFKRKGAPGKKGGWVDCNTCRDGKCKSCGRQDGESRSKYPRCRPTPSQCKGYKRRGSNLQREEMNEGREGNT